MAEYIERETAEKEVFIKQDQERQHWMEYLDQRKGTKEYSSAEKAVDNWLRGYGEAVENILAIFGKLSVDVEPVKHGEWKEITIHNGCTYDYDCVCSECRRGGHPFDNYCHNCGAKMDGKEVQE